MQGIVAAVMAGGSGKRLWPLSRSRRPKQLLPLASESTLLQETLDRCAGFEGPLIVGADALREELLESIAPSGGLTLLCEPGGRNTAAAAAAVALFVADTDPDRVVLLTPADQHVADGTAFRQAVAEAAVEARRGRIVVFGIRPDHPATTYGYVRARPGGAVPEVDAFVEKPDAKRARAFVEQGYLWNAGVFVFRASTLLAELERHAPAILAAARAALGGASREGPFVRLAREPWSGCPSAPLDTAVMERTALASVVPVDMGWADLGGYRALLEREATAAGTARVGDVVEEGCSDCYLHGEDVLVAAADIDNLIVVGTRDAVMVADIRGDGLERLVGRLEAEGRTELRDPVIGVRPWGRYRVLDRGPGFQVKRITVNPGGRLSLQRHAHRTEHWTVLAGAGRFTLDDAVSDIGPGDRVSIPSGAWHRLENPGDGVLEIVEVQIGEYLGEDDIERLEDAYGRAG